MLLIALIKQPRVRFACAVAGVGVIVAIAMVHIGGPEFRKMGSAAFYVAAMLGAGAAGWLCADAFGRAGPLGIVLAAGGGAGMTLLGAAIGAGGLIGSVGDGLPGVVFGPIGILIAAEHPAAVIWGVCMAALHLFARSLRTRGPIPWTGPRKS